MPEWLWALTGALFVVPLLRLLRPLWRALSLRGSAINGFLGSLERHISRWRGFFFPIVLALLLWKMGPAVYLYGLVVLLLLALAKRQRQTSELLMAEWMRVNTRLMPDDFFWSVDQEMGPAGCPPEHPIRGQHPEAGYDFKVEPPPKPSMGTFFRIFFTSAYMTRLIIQAEAWLGSRYYLDLFDQGARIWSLVILNLVRSKIHTVGMEKLKDLEPGKRIFLFNHISMTDFALGFGALDEYLGEEQQVKLRFVIAKDHFIDNPLIYSVGGIGRVVELAGMIPIDRKNSRNAIEALESAAKIFVNTPVDLAIYPQGTRAFRQLNHKGELLDAGFYSSARPKYMKDPLGHIKKGTAFLALDVLQALTDKDLPVHLVVVGIEGAGKLQPKGSWTMTRGIDMTYRVDDVLTLRSQDFPKLEKWKADGELTEAAKARADELTTRIERAMAKACRIDERLKAVYKDDIGQEMPEHPGLLRAYDHYLGFKLEQRTALKEAFAKLSGDVTDEQVEAIFDQILELKSKK